MTMLQETLTRLEGRVTRLEETLQKLLNQPSVDPNEQVASLPKQLTQAQLVDWLKAQGVVREPTVEEEQLAHEWEKLSEAVKQAHIRDMQHLNLDPPLSQIIMENRR